MKKRMAFILVALAIPVIIYAMQEEGWVRQEKSDFWIKPPLNWQRTQIKGTIYSSQRFSDPQANAFIEFFARPENSTATLETIADAWEQESKELLPYLSKRISSAPVQLAGGNGLLRQYEGVYYGTKLGSYVLFSFVNSTLNIASGVFVKEKASVYEVMVKNLLTSARLIAPEAGSKQ
ncbi:MAG: hypothetical protein KBA46_03545 [Candidatus Omnitrophica bacterium]|nr:hypothetical protein [Candidatus Omnitrophota bacterium]